MFGPEETDPEIRGYSLKRRTYGPKQHTYQLSLGAFTGFIIFTRINIISY
jgi:hypothetical protein